VQRTRWLVLVVAWSSFLGTARAQAEPAPDTGGEQPGETEAPPGPDAAPAQAEPDGPAQAPAPGPEPREPAPETAQPAPAPSEPTPPPSEPAAPAAAPPAEPEAARDAGAADGYGAVALIPAPGGLRPLDRVPSNAQRIDRADLDDARALGAHDALQLRLGSVMLNDVQNNPLQPDLQYRGFTASPLLGSPQGLAVYQNNVRVHDAFGDVVQWDLVPEFAIHEIDVIPGPNPLYGQNALGGALALQMKDGYRAQGYRVEATAGSFGRYRASAEYGEQFDDFAFYGGVSAFGEQGFRDESRSSAQQLYLDLRQRRTDHEVGISANLANTDLNGNGLAPIELLEQRRAAVFTYPDNTRNRSLMISADAQYALAERVSLQGNAYVRNLVRDALNGDAADIDSCDDGGMSVVCDDDDELLWSEGGATIPAADPLYNAVFNTTETASNTVGGLLQATFDQDLLRMPNQFVLGVTAEASTVTFLQRVELGWLTSERSVTGDGVFVGSDGFRTRLDVENQHASAFAADTLTLAEGLSLQLAGRLSFSRIELIDRRGDALDGTHTFARVNPSAGLTYAPVEALTLFASYGEASRAPSAIELACADPEQPCRVPNAFVADPPLDQVVTRGVELGLRGRALGTRARPALKWSVAGFGSRNFDDILFVAAARPGMGYFQNAGETQRLGVEAGAEARAGIVRGYASYALIRATFESRLTLPSEAHPDAEDDTIVVEPGSRMPGIPLHNLKAGVIVSPVVGLDLGLSTIAHGTHPYRGDEANLLGRVPAYAILNAHASYWVTDGMQLLVNARNLLDAKYETFGLLGEPDEVLEGADNPRFLGPGAPLGVWAGVVLRGL
jgi:iron complex outermembrane recepter protein